jgi:putative membrane protein
MNLLLYFLLTAAAMLGLSKLLPGFRVAGWGPALIAALVFGIVNTIVKPILFVLTLPFTILTLGLFLFVLNMIMLWITAALVPGFQVHGLWTSFIASLALAVVGMLWKALAKSS